MNAIYVQEGNNINYINPTEETIAYGSVVVLGSVCGVAAADIPSGEEGVLVMNGVWKITKDASEVTIGAKVYYDAENDVATTTESDSVLGYAIAAATAEETTVLVKLNG